MIGKGKRGITPVVATVLLIFITIVLGIIIYIFFRSLTGESVSKNGDPIEKSCENVNLEGEAFYSTGKINLVNRGPVPVIGIKVSKKKVFGDVSNIGSLSDGGSIEPGEDGEIDMGDFSSSLNVGDTLLITPILYGESSSGQGVNYLCGSEYRFSIEVQ